MFNRSNNRYTYYRSPSKIEVTENKAPTDDSIRLAEEFMDKAKKSVVCSYVFDNPNILTGSVTQFYSHSKMQTTIMFDFVFNGKRYTDEIAWHNEKCFDKYTALRLLAEEINKHMSKFMFDTFVKDKAL